MKQFLKLKNYEGDIFHDVHIHTHTYIRIYKRERGLSSRNVYNNVDVTLNDDELRIADFR